MTTATAERIQSVSNAVKIAKAELIKRITARLDSTPAERLLELAKMPDDKAISAIAKQPGEKQKSIATRNQEAMAEMKARSFERVKSRCELWDAKQACEILGVTKQALSKKAKSGHLLAYTNVSNGRMFYPSFQFKENKPKAVIAKLIKALGVDPADRVTMNFLVQHLVGQMDFSEPGERSRLLYRFELLDDSDALEVIKRDYVNALEMGQ